MARMNMMARLSSCTDVGAFKVMEGRGEKLIRGIRGVGTNERMHKNTHNTHA